MQDGRELFEMGAAERDERPAVIDRDVMGQVAPGDEQLPLVDARQLSGSIERDDGGGAGRGVVEGVAQHEHGGGGCGAGEQEQRQHGAAGEKVDEEHRERDADREIDDGAALRGFETGRQADRRVVGGFVRLEGIDADADGFEHPRAVAGFPRPAGVGRCVAGCDEAHALPQQQGAIGVGKLSHRAGVERDHVVAGQRRRRPARIDLAGDPVASDPALRADDRFGCRDGSRGQLARLSIDDERQTIVLRGAPDEQRDDHAPGGARGKLDRKHVRSFDAQRGRAGRYNHFKRHKPPHPHARHR